MSASSAAFLSLPPPTFPHTPPSLSAAPSFTLPVPQLDLASRDSTRDVSQSRCPPSRLRASSIDPDPNGEQSRITMQTRVAVRDTTPHRFQIIPLREHRLSYLPEGPNERQSEPKYRPHELICSARSQHAALSQPLSVGVSVVLISSVLISRSSVSLAQTKTCQRLHPLLTASASRRHQATNINLSFLPPQILKFQRPCESKREQAYHLLGLHYTKSSRKMPCLHRHLYMGAVILVRFLPPLRSHQNIQICRKHTEETSNRTHLYKIKSMVLILAPLQGE